MKTMNPFVVATIAVTLVPAKSYAAEMIDVWSDPSARYTVVQLKKKSGKTLDITTMREGKSGVSFSKREVNCRSYKFRYLGDGDTLQEMNVSKPNSKLGNLIKGSISEIVSDFACRKAGWR